MLITPLYRCNARTAYRQIADGSGATVADCPSYLDGPTLAEAMANAEVIVSGTYHPAATPGPWHVAEAVGGGWLVLGGPCAVIVAMVRRRDDETEVAARIAAAYPLTSP